MAYCHIDHQLNNYLAKEDRDDMYERAVAAEMEPLLAGDYSPELPVNINEALGEMPDELVKLVRTSHPLIKEWIDNYWNKLAREKAGSNIEDRANEAPEPDYH